MTTNALTRPASRAIAAIPHLAGTRPRAFDKAGLYSRMVPFGGVAILALAIDAADLSRHDATTAIVGAACLVLAIVTGLFVPWSRLPSLAEVVPPLSYVAAAMFIRDSSGGAPSGVVALYALPLVWASLYGDRRQVVVITVAIVLALVVPVLVVGAPRYPQEEWQLIGINGLVALLLGGTIHGLMNRIGIQAREATVRSAELARSEAGLQAVLRTAHDAIVTLETTGLIRDVNPAAEEMFGGARQRLVGLDLVESLGAAHEREFLRRGLSDIAIESVSQDRRVFGTELVRLDGQSFPVDVSIGVAIEDGRPIVHAFARDVSERRRMEVAARQHEADLRALLATSRQLVGVADAGTLRRQICEASIRLVGGAIAVLLEPDGDELAVTATAGGSMPAARMPLTGTPGACAIVYHSGRPLFSGDTRGDPLIANSLAALADVRAGYWQPVLGAAGAVGVLVVCWTEPLEGLDQRTESILNLLAGQAGVALEMAGLVATLEGLARTDGLTRIANRRTFDETVAAEVARASRSGEPLSLILLDLDHFKRFNDTRGHQAGDRLLMDVAAAWTRELRPSDSLARYGGEEFVVVLPDCSTDAAMRVAARLRGDVPGKETASAGVATLAPGETAIELIARADAAMYRAKSEGRDRAVAA